MKRFLTTIVCVLCVLAAYAVSYGTSYKGSGYSGRIYTTSSVRATSVGSGGVIASVPMGAMSSTSLHTNRGMLMSNIQTSASIVLGGATPQLTTEFPPLPGMCTHCHWVEDEYGNVYCSECGCKLDEGGCTCDPCRCPIGDGWQVWLFMAGMAIVYAAIKKRKASL